jgi:hypothetical protein
MRRARRPNAVVERPNYGILLVINVVALSNYGVALLNYQIRQDNTVVRLGKYRVGPDKYRLGLDIYEDGVDINEDGEEINGVPGVGEALGTVDDRTFRVRVMSARLVSGIT